ncbi:Light-harvesting protein B-870 beta chain [Dissostichus eleginoides]|uniref:Light-harvesting protein B-870 beta chain n=1 Tax=Dissostichus eleginoides TaxID=100907 RepID=A0AAD9CNK6_DISEL|nr:Light-harvesting protein B-870 beta chain [Dissostichus eleginoides]
MASEAGGTEEGPTAELAQRNHAVPNAALSAYIYVAVRSNAALTLLHDHRLRRGQKRTVLEEYMKGGVGEGEATSAAVQPRSKFTHR